MSQLKIERGVPIPTPIQRSGRPRKYPWAEMEVGDSFYIPLKNGQDIGALQNTMGSLAIRFFGKRGQATRQEGNGVRVWRIK